MRVLGIDPGLAIMGYGVVNETTDGLRLIDYGAVYTKAGVPTPLRLSDIFDGVGQLIEKFKPDAVAVEELFFNQNVTTAIAVAQARGAALTAAAKTGVRLYEYTPLQVKQAVAGYGRADKTQVQAMVMALLDLREVPKPDDAADAVAVAICHIHSGAFSREFEIR